MGIGLRAWLGAALVVAGGVMGGGIVPSALAGVTRCPPIAGGGVVLDAIPGETRLTWIDTRLARTAHRARVWTWGWGLGIAGATVANLVPLAFVSKEDRVDWYVGAATTVVGIVPLLVAPLDVIDDSRVLRAGIAAAPPNDDVCRRLAGAEDVLVRDAQNQEDGQRWWLHAGNVVLNTGVGLFLGLAYNHWGAGALNAVVGSAIGELIILSQPVDSIADLRDYRKGALGDERAPRLSLWSVGYRAQF